ncbi:MAG: hypothetical protein J5I94_26255, partial [Phaeodactylibacter sp.]|nr:hypothetical protein [Phaeodactylibacter sp.]
EISKKGVQDILEDRYGFIWFGGNGLYRYDGYHPRQYKPGSDDSTAVDFGTVYALLEDKQGRIWIGSSNGLFRYEREAGRIQSICRDQLTNRFGKAARIMSLFEDSNGRVWIGSEDKLFVVPVGDSSAIQPVEGLDIGHSNWFREGGVRSILECDSGRLFAASTSGLWQVKNGLTLIRHVPDEFADGVLDFRIENAAWGKGDTLWLATAEGLWAFDAGSSRFYKMVIPGYARQIVNALWVDKQNQVWIAVKDEIFTRSGEGTFRKLEGNTHYLFDGIRAITKGRQGNLWFGGNHGIGMLDLNQDQRLPFYQIGNGSPYHDNHFYRIVQDHSGGFWFRMYRSGLGYCPALDDEFEILLEPPVYYFGEEVKGICTDVDGNVWVITYTNGLFLFEKGHTAYRSIDLGDSLRRIAIPSAIIADNQDSRLLWFSSRAGLCSVDRFTLERKWYHPRDDLPWLDLDAIGMIGQADDGNIWCDLTARSKHIVGYFDRRKGRFFAEPNLPGRPEATWICQFKPVAEGEMWVATNRGMIVIDTRQKKQRFWTEENGFPTNDPLSITPDREGNIWFTGERTIYKYDGKGFDRYNANAAIDRFDNTSSALTREGMVAFGGVNGLHVFDPKKLEK